MTEANVTRRGMIGGSIGQRNCESFLHLIFDRIGGDRGFVCATGHCFDDFRSRSTG